jgi:hypothetical protein
MEGVGMTGKKLAIVSSDNIPIDQLLGYLVILVHHNFRMGQEEMEKVLAESEIPKEYWPRKPRNKNAFQKACRLLQTTAAIKERFIDPANGMELWFDVDYFVDALPDENRQLSRKIQYTSGSKEYISEDTKKLLDIYVEKTQKEPEKMAIFEFNEKKEGEKEITMVPIYSANNPLSIKEMTEAQYEKLMETYEELKVSYTERYLKMAFNEMMYGLEAIPYCGSAGNIWFVPKPGVDAVNSFGKAYRTIHEMLGQQYTWRMIPVIDTELQRTHIKEDVEREILKRYEQYLESLGQRMEKIKTQEDLDIIKEKAAENNTKFEQELNNHLIDRYNSILKTSINIKMNNIQQKTTKMHMNGRIKRALKFLETGM